MSSVKLSLFLLRRESSPITFRSSTSIRFTGAESPRFSGGQSGPSASNATMTDSLRAIVAFDADGPLCPPENLGDLTPVKRMEVLDIEGNLKRVHLSKKSDSFTDDTGRRIAGPMSVTSAYEPFQAWHRQVTRAQGPPLRIRFSWILRRTGGVVGRFADRYALFVVMVVAAATCVAPGAARKSARRDPGLGEEIPFELALLLRPVGDHFTSFDRHIVAKCISLDLLGML